jgi:hypothetical protein
VHSSKSITNLGTPARIRASPNSFTAKLFIKEPLPSQRIQLNPSNFPTFIDESLATNSVPMSDGYWQKLNVGFPNGQTITSHNFRLLKKAHQPNP